MCKRERVCVKEGERKNVCVCEREKIDTLFTLKTVYLSLLCCNGVLWEWKQTVVETLIYSPRQDYHWINAL